MIVMASSPFQHVMHCHALDIWTQIAVFDLQYPLCLSLLANKKIDVLPLVTHRLGFTEEEVVKGFDTALRSAETKAIKVMFNL